MIEREQIRSAFEQAAGVQVRWASARTTKGDFDGRPNTLELFGVPASEQRRRHRELRALRSWAEELLGRPIIIVQHTPEAVRLHYAWILGIVSRESTVLSTRASGSVAWVEATLPVGSRDPLPAYLAESKQAHPMNRPSIARITAHLL